MPCDVITPLGCERQLTFKLNRVRPICKPKIKATSDVDMNHYLQGKISRLAIL